MTSRGEILEWRRDVSSQAAAYLVIRIDSAATGALFAELTRIRFRSLARGQPSNMSCFLRLDGPEGHDDVFRSAGDPPPRAVRGVTDLLKTLAAALRALEPRTGDSMRCLRR